MWERPIPQTEEQIIAFLSSKLIKGCGKKQAALIVNKLGKDTIQTINEQGVASLNGIKGIGKKRSEQIVESIKDTFEIQKIISQLLVYGITATIAMKAYKKYESNTVPYILENPYRLIEIDNIGFLKADEIAKRIGILPTSSFRMDACVAFVLNKSCHEGGHCFINEQELLKKTELALNHNSKGNDIVTFLELEQSVMRLDGEKIVIENGSVYPKRLHDYEERLARKLSYMRDSRGGEALSFLNKKIVEYQKKNSIVLADSQREGIERLFYEQMLVLTGGPGTGKTTVVKAMLDVFKATYPNAKIILAAPTGRASRKLSEVTNHEANTIHSVIGLRPFEAPEYNAKNPLDADLLIVDEFSMVDLTIAHLLVDALKKNTKVLFVGDIDQLPSVSPGNVLSDLITAGVPTVRLTEVFRQAQQSQIVTNAHRVNKGQPLLLDTSKNDFYFIQEESPEQSAQIIVDSVIRFMQLGYKLADILVLSPMKKGECGTENINALIQESINPIDYYKNEWVFGDRIFREADKVLQTKNNKDKDIYNGDIGIIQSIVTNVNPETNEKYEVMNISFNGKMVEFKKDEVHSLILGYAITVHKSQGGEAPIVISPIVTQHSNMLARNLIYTGMTRAKEKVVYIGTHKAMNLAIRNNKITKRNSYLSERIKMNIALADRFKNESKVLQM